MTKADDRKIAALAKKNAAKAVPQKKKLRRQYDDTLQNETEDDQDARYLFQQMKKACKLIYTTIANTTKINATRI